MTTNEYQLGFGAMAANFGLEKRPYGNGIKYNFPPSWENGWIMEMNAAKGLFVSSAWFIPTKTLSYTMEIEKPCMLIFCVDCGDITFTQRGKSAKHLTPINHVIVNPKKPLKITFPANVHTCYTCVLVFEEFIQKFLKDRPLDPPFSMDNLACLQETHYNTPNITLVLEQIRWGVRSGDMPLMNFECKMGELLSLIVCNTQRERPWIDNRRNHVTWENEQKTYGVKVNIDQDVLNPPSMIAMCRLAEMSETKLRRSFKQLYHMTIFDYIRTETMKRAMMFLGADELSIKNIAEKCGYESPSKFTAAFKKTHGITPRQFRKGFGL
ncbi:helix-turn-helix domain-containing protein [Clostridium tagluense]|uniref:AraC family transcriptional regulator n=1 Tax=Clostridium tagluense TaxID=360422 RepID=A0A401UGH3_9CLOT|nr:AraC family transcriptional regulator [Clostridium tagluense]GCD08638.1 AraC family transcriptional regulator [Clostridium tagluense]